MRKLSLAFALLIPTIRVYAGDITPPPTKVEPVTEVLHGVTIIDPYRWLEDQNSAETRAWLAAQDKFARGYLDSIPARDQIRKKLISMMRIDSVSSPVVRNGRHFFSRRLALQDRPSICMRQGFSGKDEVLVDPGKATDDPTSSLMLVGPSEDGSLMVYAIRRGGEDEGEIRILDVNTRSELPDRLPRARYMGGALKPDNSGFYYSRFTPDQGARVWYHAMGSDPKADQQIFGAGYGPTQTMRVALSDNGRWLLIHVSDGRPSRRTELYVRNLTQPGPLVAILNQDGDFTPCFAGDALLLTTNWKAPNRRILRVDLNHPAPEAWKEIVPESKFAIEGASVAGGRVLVSYLENIATRVRQIDVNGKPLGDLVLPGIGTASISGDRWADDEAFFTFSSFVGPATTYRFSVSTGKRDLWFRPKIPIDTGNIEVKQVWYASKDGTRVPMFVVLRRGLPLDGDRPVILTGYGGFNQPSLPRFNPGAALWAGAGGVFALANIRGGGEFGESWHKAGMFEQKQNVFDDFIAAAEWLIQNKYTRPSRLSIMGGSNGGLLMGAMMTQRPDLFGAIVCTFPLLDMVRFHKMSVGAWWAAEYGSAEDPKQFAYLYKYSPYHNVKKGTRFPAVLFVSGDMDTRVDPAHARKMAALLQAANAGDTPILLRYDVKSGHSGIANVRIALEQRLDTFSFLAARLGMKIE